MPGRTGQHVVGVVDQVHEAKVIARVQQVADEAEALMQIHVFQGLCRLRHPRHVRHVRQLITQAMPGSVGAA